MGRFEGLPGILVPARGSAPPVFKVSRDSFVDSYNGVKGTCRPGPGEHPEIWISRGQWDLRDESNPRETFLLRPRTVCFEAQKSDTRSQI